MKNAIKQRRSVRNYNGMVISEEHEKLILSYISKPENLVGKFGHKMKIYLNKTDGRKSGKIGTYGIIKNAPAYLVTVCETSKEALVDCGYVFEKLVLYIESIGLNTCWMGGTFNRNKIKLQDQISANEMITIISPVGYGASKSSIIDKTFRRLAKSDHRKDFDLLFFNEDFEHRIEESFIIDILEQVRIAPSASNQQPWRIVMGADGTVHFYIERTPDYGKGKLSYDIQMVDIGIAISHYEIMVGELAYHINDPGITLYNQETSYIVSVKAI